MTLLLAEDRRIHESSPDDTIEPGEKQDSQNRLWWVVYSREGQEKSLALKLGERQIPFYLPLAPIQQNLAEFPAQSHVPLFGKLLFLFGSEEECRAILSTRLVSRILPVDDEDRLRQSLLHLHQLIDTDYSLTIEKCITSGPQVRVAGGQLDGVEGVLVQRSGGKRLLVAIEEIGQGVSMAVEHLPHGSLSPVAV